MNLLVECHILDNRTTEGVSVYLIGLYKAMISLADDINFYFMAKDVEHLQTIFGKKNNIHYIPLKHGKLFRYLYEIPQLVKKYKIDYVHFQYMISPFCKCKVIDTLHDILFEDFKECFPFKYRVSRSLVFKYSARNSDVVLTVSNYSKKRIEALYGVCADKIAITPNAVAQDWYNISEETATKYVSREISNPYILYVSRVEPRKNHLLLIKAYNELELWKQKYDLVLIGRYDIKNPLLDEYLENMKPEARMCIKFVNQASFPNLLCWCKMTSLFVYASMGEGFGIPAIEAAAAGVPLLCSKATAMQDFPFPEEVFFDVHDIEDLKKKMLLMLNNYSYVELVKENVKKKYSWEQSAKSLLMQINE